MEAVPAHQLHMLQKISLSKGACSTTLFIPLEVHLMQTLWYVHTSSAACMCQVVGALQCITLTEQIRRFNNHLSCMRLSPQGLRQDYLEREPSLILACKAQTVSEGDWIVDTQLTVRTGLHNQISLAHHLCWCTKTLSKSILFTSSNMLPVESCKPINPAVSWMSLHSCVEAQ